MMSDFPNIQPGGGACRDGTEYPTAYPGTQMAGSLSEYVKYLR